MRIQVNSGVLLDNTMAFVPSTPPEGGPGGMIVYGVLPPDSTVEGTREKGPEDLVADADTALTQISTQAGQVMSQVANLLGEVGGLIDTKQIQKLIDTLSTETTLIAANVEHLTRYRVAAHSAGSKRSASPSTSVPSSARLALSAMASFGSKARPASWATAAGSGSRPARQSSSNVRASSAGEILSNQQLQLAARRPGTVFGSVISACAGRWPQSHVRASSRRLRTAPRTTLRGVLRVRIQILDNIGHRDRGVFGVPAIIVRDHRDGGVADLGLPSQLGFLQVRHADDVHAPAPIQVRLRLGRERGALHAQVRAAEIRLHAALDAGVVEQPADVRTNRIGEADMRHQAFAEERGHTPARAVDELIGDHEIARLMLFLQDADGAEREDPFDAQFLESINVGAEVQLGGLMRWPRPWRARKATVLPSSSPTT